METRSIKNPIIDACMKEVNGAPHGAVLVIREEVPNNLEHTDNETNHIAALKQMSSNSSRELIVAVKPHYYKDGEKYIAIQDSSEVVALDETLVIERIISEATNEVPQDQLGPVVVKVNSSEFAEMTNGKIPATKEAFVAALKSSYVATQELKNVPQLEKNTENVDGKIPATIPSELNSEVRAKVALFTVEPVAPKEVVSAQVIAIPVSEQMIKSAPQPKQEAAAAVENPVVVESVEIKAQTPEVDENEWVKNATGDGFIPVDKANVVSVNSDLQPVAAVAEAVFSVELVLTQEQQKTAFYNVLNLYTDANDARLGIKEERTKLLHEVSRVTRGVNLENEVRLSPDSAHDFLTAQAKVIKSRDAVLAEEYLIVAEASKIYLEGKSAKPETGITGFVNNIKYFKNSRIRREEEAARAKIGNLLAIYDEKKYTETKGALIDYQVKRMRWENSKLP